MLWLIKNKQLARGGWGLGKLNKLKTSIMREAR